MEENGRFRAVTPPPELALTDIFMGEPAMTPLLEEQDIAPFKPATDVIVIGVAKAPGGEARSDWPVALSIENTDGTSRLRWGFHVRGATVWQRHWRQWRQGKARPTTEVPLDYTLAYGGTLRGQDGTPVEYFEENPAGIGFATPAALNGADERPAPQIGELGEFMAAGEPTLPMSVRGFRHIAKTWMPRRASAGTFDEAWEQDRHPRMPLDFDAAFWNSAPTALQVKPYLQGNETILLEGFDPRPGPVRLPLPATCLSIQLAGDAQTEAMMTLDTVVIDLLEAPVMDLTWRTLISEPNNYFHAEITAHPLARGN
ncbi:DUF2169 domain-containing protein [Paracoccus onubensis]|uniref:DUF2169 domain-containing protein n=2 Tax=Paracoccus onubensis TaxID=1675788 RepID=A0A418T033_9RHOB|nr:DUF2169 domain-containing protein [Paracoccus onubensis]